MSGFDVSILLRLVDNLTSPSRRAAQSYNSLAQSVSRSSNQIRSASASAATGINSIGAAATRANKQVSGLFGTMRNGQRSGRGGGMMIGGNQDLFRAMGGWMMFRGGLNAAENVQAAENKFKALVDNVTDDQMKAIREQLKARMMRSGHTYDALIGAAGDAAQIVGSANMAGDITTAASSWRSSTPTARTSPTSPRRWLRSSGRRARSRSCTSSPTSSPSSRSWARQPPAARSKPTRTSSARRASTASRWPTCSPRSA